MRFVQYRILTRILNLVEIPDYVYAFEKNKSIPSMANLHTNKEVVISLDLKDFFHSIKQSMVFEILGRLGIHSLPARVLSELCTYKAFVPQGALTSPKIANIITAFSFGPTVKEYCDTKGLTLTIYADDITMSGTVLTGNIPGIINDVTAIVRRYGFRINFDKTKVMRKTRRQYVCGVVVNEKTNLLKKERYKLRAIVHNIAKNGLSTEAAKSNVSPSEFANHIRGKVNWFRQLNPILGERLYHKLDTHLKENPVEVPNGLIPTTVILENPIDLPIKEEATESVPW
jgi:RNA-directed DNA polymerase